MNPVLVFVLVLRRCGWKHSDIPWKSVREQFDYCNEEVAA